MNLNFKLLVDYYVGGLLHFFLKPPTVFLGKILRRDHDLSRCTTVTVMKLLGGGSLVIAYPALLAIKSAPRVKRLQCLTTPATEPFARLLGVFDEIIVIRDNSVRSLVQDSIVAIRKLFRCDAIVDLEIHSRLTTVFSLLTCARNRVGFYTNISFWRKGLATHLLFCNLSSGIFYFYDQIALLFGAGDPDPKLSQSLFRARAGANPDTASLRIALAPCCSDLGKERMLEPEDWVAILSRRLMGLAQVELHLLGAPSDRQRLQRVADLMAAEFPAVVAVNHGGRTSLAESVRLLSQAGELYCVDSSMLHFARLLGVPTISYWGPTDPMTRLRPFPGSRDEVHYTKIPCSPCVHMAQEPPCRGNNICMRAALDPEVAINCNPPWLADQHTAIAPRQLAPPPLRRAVFLDRDGTLIEEVGYCADPGKVKLYAGVREALQQLRAAGFLLIVVTNQSGIGRGYFSEQDYLRVQAEFERQLGPATLDAAYFCPDAPNSPSSRRKPAPGMILEAAKDFRLDLSRSFIVGDKASDIECGRFAGCGAILVLTGYGRNHLDCAPDFVAESFADVPEYLVRN